MKKFLPLIALFVLLGALVCGRRADRMDQRQVQGFYQELMPEAASFRPLNDRVAAALDASGATLAHVGVSSHIGYGGPLLVGVIVRPDGSLGNPLIFTHRETPAYLRKIEQQGFYRQMETRRADDALVPGFDIDAVSGATLSSRAIALGVAGIAHTVAAQGMGLTPKKADSPWRAGVDEIAAAMLFAFSLLASRVKKLARCRPAFLGLGIVILGFRLNRAFSVALPQAAFMGFFPDVTQNLLWYIVITGAVLPAVALGKNLYCVHVCPFCGVQELAHAISRIDLPVGPAMKIIRLLRQVFLFAALFIGFLSLNPSCASYEPFGAIFGLNGENPTWYLLFVVLVGSFFFRRFWCHAFCPAGAFLDFIASKRRDAGRLLRGGKVHRTDAAPFTGIPAVPSAEKKEGKRPGAQKRKTAAALPVFLLFYAAGAFIIVRIVLENTGLLSWVRGQGVRIPFF